MRGSRLRRLVHRHGRDVAEAELVRHAVAVAVNVLSGDLDGLHSELVVARVGHEVAHGAHRALPLERLDEQIRVHAAETGVVVLSARPGVAARGGAAHDDGPVVDAFRDERHAASRRLRRGPRLRARGVARRVQGVTDTSCARSWRPAQHEHRRRVALDHLRDVAAVQRIAVNVGVHGTRSVGNRRSVAAGLAGLCVGAGRSCRCMRRPLPGARQVGARDACEALSLPDPRSDAVELVERRSEQRIAAFERFDEALEGIGNRVHLRLECSAPRRRSPFARRARPRGFLRG